jgi:hypothetical protein
LIRNLQAILTGLPGEARATPVLTSAWPTA